MDAPAGDKFGDLLRRHRRAAGLTQEELGARAQVSSREVSDLERGLRRRPWSDTVKLLADALKLGPAERGQLETAARRASLPSPKLSPDERARAAHAAPTALAGPLSLPTRLTSFVGREQELSKVRELLQANRLLTLTGAGGVGKTSLAFAAASAVQTHFVDGVTLAELAALTDGDLVPNTVAAVVGVREQPGEPVLKTLATALGMTQRLLVLDNCEHLLVSCARLVEVLLQGCPRLRILVTSREPLRVGPEVIWRVPSLALPSPGSSRLDELATCESVRLFVERAEAVRPGFTLTIANAAAVGEICRRLDGIPLAIELAAARVGVLTPEQIAQHLSDRFSLLTAGSRTALPRHRTLQALLDWSYQLLTASERTFFRRLAVFAGSFTLAAAAAVCEDSGHSGAALDLLIGLVDKSLVLVEDPGPTGTSEARYRLLESLREYARACLNHAGEELPISQRHLRWYLALAEDGRRELHGTKQQLWLEQFETNHDNLRAALRSAIVSHDVESGLRLASVLYQFWMQRHPSEGRAWLGTLLADSSGIAESGTRAWALAIAGCLAGQQGDYHAARGLLEQGVALGREVTELAAVALALLGLSAIDRSQGDFPSAQRRLEQSLELYRQVGDKWGAARCLFLLAELAGGHGNLLTAQVDFQESLMLFREQGDRWGTAYSLRALGFAAWRLDDVLTAQSFCEESLAIGRDLGDRAVIAWSVWCLGLIAMKRQDYSAARSKIRESIEIFREREERGAVAHVLGGFAALAAVQGDPWRALRLAGSATHIREVIGARMLPTDATDLVQWLVPARHALSPAQQAMAWAEGQAMTLEQAIVYALEEDGG